MNIGKQYYDEVIELLGNLIDNMEEETIERSYSNGCGTDYEYDDVYAIPEEDFDMEKVQALYNNLKGLRASKIENVVGKEKEL